MQMRLIRDTVIHWGDVFREDGASQAHSYPATTCRMYLLLYNITLLAKLARVARGHAGVRYYGDW